MSSDEANQAGKSGKDDPNEAKLSERMRELDKRLSEFETDESSRSAKDKERESNSSALAKAMRLSSEFIAGIIAGALLGWLLDKFAGTSPWGFIIFLMLGFAAGIRNLMRSANMMDTPSDKN